MWTAILNALGWCMLKLYELVQSYGLAIILFTLFSKIILLPFAMKSKKSMLKMSAFTPKMQEIEAKYKNDKDRYNQEIQKLYKEEKVNPLGGCLWTLLPWPIFIALYSVMRLPLTHMLGITAEEITAITNLPVIINALGDAISTVSQNELPLMNAINTNFDAVVAALPQLADRLQIIDFNFLGMNLSVTPNWQYLNVYWFLPIVSAAAMWFSSFLMQRMQGQTQEQQQSGSTKFMNWLGPIMSLVIGFSWPASMSFYWIANSLLGTLQDVLLTLYYRKKLGLKSPKEVKAEKEAKEAEERRKAQERAARIEQLKAEGAQPSAKRGQMSSKKYKQLKAQQQSQQSQKSLKSAGDPADADASGEVEPWERGDSSSARVEEAGAPAANETEGAEERTDDKK